jgi:hypothetical protein
MVTRAVAAPAIERVKTECYFIDAAGVEWKVMDLVPLWPGSPPRLRYPSMPNACARIFSRYEKRDGAFEPELVEERRYDFQEGETRWFVEVEWQRQLNSSRNTVG